MNIANRTEHKSGNNQKKSVPYDTYGMRYFIFYMESLLWRIQYLLKGQRDNRTVPLFIRWIGGSFSHAVIKYFLNASAGIKAV